MALKIVTKVPNVTTDQIPIRSAKALHNTYATLKSITQVVVPAIARVMDPNEAFRERHGFHVDEEFRTYILPELTLISSAPEVTLTVSDVTQITNDLTVWQDLEQHLSEWYHITSFIDKQPKGEDGILLTDCENIFFMRVGGRVYAIRVRWLTLSCRWGVSGWTFDGYDPLPIGTRVFLRNFVPCHLCV